MTASASALQDRGATAPQSSKFLDTYKPRRLSYTVSVAFLLIAVAALCFMFYGYLLYGHLDELPFLGSYIATFDEILLLKAGAVSIALCASLIVLNLWLHHFMPFRFEIEREFINALTMSHIITKELEQDAIEWRIKTNRFKRKARIDFYVLAPECEFEDMLKKVNGFRTAFKGAVRVVPDRSKAPYTMTIVIYYGDEINEY